MKFRKRIAIFAVLFILLALLCSCSGQKGKEPAQINSIEDLNGKKIGILTGSVAYQTIQKYIKDAYIVFQCRC